MEDGVNQEDSENAVGAYDQFIGAQVCLSGKRGRKIMAGVTKNVDSNEGDPRGIEHLNLSADHSLYEVSFPNGLTEDFTANVISDHVIFQVD